MNAAKSEALAAPTVRASMKTKTNQIKEFKVEFNTTPAARTNAAKTAEAQTPGDRACRFAMGAETVLMNFGRKEDSDLAWGFHRLALEAAVALNDVIDDGSLSDLEDVANRYAQVNAIVAATAKEADDDLLFAGEALIEATKFMLDAEICRRMTLSAMHSGAAQGQVA